MMDKARAAEISGDIHHASRPLLLQYKEMEPELS
jgi:hypothetical protein